MSTRSEMLPEFEYLIDLVLDMQEKWFFAECPEAKALYKQFKADFKVYKYASDEHIENWVDPKTGKMVRMERPDYLTIDLIRQRAKIERVIRLAHKKKQAQRKREADIKEYQKQEKRWTKALEKGEVTQDLFNSMKKRGFKTLGLELVGGY